MKVGYTFPKREVWPGFRSKFTKDIQTMSKFILNTTLIKEGLDAIALNDNEVARAIDQVGYPQPRIRASGFEAFIAIVIGQQLSNKAAATILGRVRSLLPEFTAANLLALPDGALRTAGLSARKVEYATDLACAIIDRRFCPDKFNSMDDATVIENIVALRGFGQWSAEIYLMFSLQRQDIFPADDLALQKSLQKLKGLEKCPTASTARKLVKHWTPWRSVGSLFLWHYYQNAAN